MPRAFFRDPPQPAVRCRHPIVLLHGLFGFVQKRFGIFEANYFRGVVPYLEAAGNTAHTLGVHPWQTIDYRARQIREAIESDPLLQDRPLHLIGHSMGGLDARCLVSALGYGDRILSVTTIATPHRGSILADFLARVPGVPRILPAIPDLTHSACRMFNERFPDDPRVLYLSVPVGSPLWSCCPLMWPWWVLLWLEGGRNDGQVTLESATWGEVLEVMRADHVQVIGMRYGLNALMREHHLSLYGRITRALADRGL